MAFSPDHPKIMDREDGVYPLNQFNQTFAHLGYRLVVHLDRVHMDGHFTVKFMAQLQLEQIGRIVHHQHIHCTGHLRM